MTVITNTLLTLFMSHLVSSMDYGGGGVYDSPMAADYYVQRFGFMFGGGWSGVPWMMAIKVISEPSSSPILPRTMYNPSGLYSAEGAEGMEESVAKFQHPFIPTKSFTAFNKEKKMVELGTLTVEAKQKLKTFPRFMAVP